MRAAELYGWLGELPEDVEVMVFDAAEGTLLPIDGVGSVGFDTDQPAFIRINPEPKE
jgi:hypothetical protein